MLEVRPWYPTGKYSNPGGSERFPNTAWAALRTWEREQEKSVKSPIDNGRWRVVSEMGDLVDGGREAMLVRWDCIHFLVSACCDFGSAAKELSVSCWRH
jgi:hypothetical protein